jgi:hypothetical protein
MDIKDITIEDDIITITALIEDKVLLRLSDSVNPAEYGPAICTAVIDITDVPDWINLSLLSQIERMHVLKSLFNFDRLDWEVVENSIDDFNDVY